MQRREWLKAIGTIGIGGLAGCSSKGSDTVTFTSTTSKSTTTITEGEGDVGIGNSENETTTEKLEEEEPTVYEKTTASEQADTRLEFGDWHEFEHNNLALRMDSLEYENYIKGIGEDMMWSEKHDFKMPAEGIWAVFTYTTKGLSNKAYSLSPGFWTAEFNGDKYSLTDELGRTPVYNTGTLIYNEDKEKWEYEHLSILQFDPKQKDPGGRGEKVQTWRAFDIPKKYEGANDVRIGYDYSEDDGWNVVWER